MEINSPQRMEGEVWMQQFNLHLSCWLAEQRQQPMEFEQAVNALRNMLEREPATAGYVANLLSTLIKQHVKVLPENNLEVAAKRGLEALLLVNKDSAFRLLTRSNLLNHLALAYLGQGKYGRALDEVLASLTHLNDPKCADLVMTRMIRAQACLLEGECREALLEFAPTVAAYDEAEAAAAEITEDDQRMSDALLAQVCFEYPVGSEHLPKEALGAEFTLLWEQLCDLRIKAAVGASRCAVMSAPRSIDERLQTIVAVCRCNGIGDTTPLELATVICSASPKVARESVQQIIEMVDLLGLEVAEFSAVLHAALSVTSESAEDKQADWDAAAKGVARTEEPLMRAAAYGLLLLSHEETPAREPIVDRFIASLDLLASKRDRRLNLPANRLVFDEPVLLSLQALCARGEGLLPWMYFERTLIAKLIDYDFSGLSPVDHWFNIDLTENAFDDLNKLARDRLARANCALRDWDDTLALIVRTVNGRSLFIALTGEPEPVAVFAGQEFATKVRALTDYLHEQIGLIQYTGSASSPERLKVLAQATYEAMPEKIRIMVASCEQLLLCPDHRAEGGSVPFELFRNEQEWLGIDKVVARFPNLRTLISCLEGTTRRDSHKRLLALAVPDADALPHLKYAENEVNSIRNMLQEWGWDVPVVHEKRIKPKYILDRLPYVSHLHIAAHGEVTGSEESLMLHDGDKLFASTLLGIFIPRMPTAYINACELGTSRWGGAGRAQSMPYALLRAGSRSVIANLLPVDDEVSSRLAEQLYANMNTMTFGESLRAVRQTFATEGVHPLLWGSTVLIGDPGMSFVDKNVPSSVTRAYLDTMVLNRGSDEERQEAVAAIALRRTREPEDVRLLASIGLLQAINELDNIESRVSLGVIADACRLAYEIDYLPLLGLLIYMSSKYFDTHFLAEDKIRFYDNAINIFESLEEEGNPWKQMLDELLVDWFKLTCGDRAPKAQLHGPQGEDTEKFMGAVNVIMDIQLAMEARDIRDGRGPVACRDESSAENILWNAVISSRLYALDDMPEIYDFSRILVEKLVSLKAFPETSSEEAVISAAGLLYWLWGSQNQLQLAQEIIIGQVGVLNEMIISLQKSWRVEKWFQPFQQFEQHMCQELENLGGLPYDDKLYSRINEVMKGLQSSAENVLKHASEKTPEHLCEVTVCLIGCFIKHNTYSYTQGSVPEDISEKLMKIQNYINAQAEGKIYPWLDRGFQSIREEEPDELIRWKYGLN
ncbi:MAG: CHAT domain-containing protein [Deltaproteobacteria bacterium]